MKAEALKHAMNYGLGLGLLFFLNFFVGMFPGWNFLQILFWIAIPIVGYKLCVNCREKIYGGVMSYGQVVWYNFQLYFYASLVSAAMKVFYFKFINPQYLSDLIEQVAAVMDGMSLPNVEEMVSLLYQVYTPLNFALLNMFFTVTVIGVIVSLITAAIVYKKPSLFDKKTEEEW